MSALSCPALGLLRRRRHVARVFAKHARYIDARFHGGDRLVDDATLVRVVAHFDVADQREVLAERMANEAVVGEDATQVRMALEYDAEQVEGLAFEPVH